MSQFPWRGPLCSLTFSLTYLDLSSMPNYFQNNIWVTAPTTYAYEMHVGEFHYHQSVLHLRILLVTFVN